MRYIGINPTDGAVTRCNPRPCERLAALIHEEAPDASALPVGVEHDQVDLRGALGVAARDEGVRRRQLADVAEKRALQVLVGRLGAFGRLG